MNSIDRAITPLHVLFADTGINVVKLEDLNDLVESSNDFGDSVYFAHALLTCELFTTEERETVVDLILNVIYPTTGKFKFPILVLAMFMKYCKDNNFSSQERRTTMTRFLNGEDYTAIKFEKIDDTQTLNVVNEAMKGVDLDTIRKKPALINYYVGQVMKATKGKVNVTVVKSLIEDFVKNNG